MKRATFWKIDLTGKEVTAIPPAKPNWLTLVNRLVDINAKSLPRVWFQTSQKEICWLKQGTLWKYVKASSTPETN